MSFDKDFIFLIIEKDTGDLKKLTLLETQVRDMPFGTCLSLLDGGRCYPLTEGQPAQHGVHSVVLAVLGLPGTRAFFDHLEEPRGDGPLPGLGFRRLGLLTDLPWPDETGPDHARSGGPREWWEVVFADAGNDWAADRGGALHLLLLLLD